MSHVQDDVLVREKTTCNAPKVSWARIDGILVMPKVVFASGNGFRAVPKVPLAAKNGFSVVSDVRGVSQLGFLTVPKYAPDHDAARSQPVGGGSLGHGDRWAGLQPWHPPEQYLNQLRASSAGPQESDDAWW